MDYFSDEILILWEEYVCLYVCVGEKWETGRDFGNNNLHIQ